MTSTASDSPFSTMEDAIKHFSQGTFVVVMDDDNRENEGDIVLAAQFATPEKIAFALRHTSGILCAPVTPEIATRLELPPMIENNTDPNRTAFTVSIDHIRTTTGVSAHDRSLTFQSLADVNTDASQYRKPGHIFPLVARPGGVLERRGHTEATLDLCKLSGLYPVGFLVELMNPDGTMARLPDCIEFARKYNFPLITVEQIAEYRRQHATGVESLVQTPEISKNVELVASCSLPIERHGKFLGNWDCKVFHSKRDQATHVVLIKGQLPTDQPVLTRVHSECFTGNTLGSIRCDCGEQLDQSLLKIHENGSGVVVYVGGHEGRGIGLINKIKAYALQDSHNLDTYQSNEFLGFKKDLRNYDSVLSILKALNIQSIDIMTNNKFKYQALTSLIAKVTSLDSKSHEHNEKYLEAKRKEQSIVTHQEKTPEKPQETATKNNAATTTKIMIEQSVVEIPSNHGIVTATNTMSHNLASEGDLKKEIPISLPTPSNVSRLTIGFVRTAWNQQMVDSLADQTRQHLIERGILAENILEARVPGSFELPWAAQRLIKDKKVDVVVCFGVLLKGETMHFEYISGSVAQGLMQLQLTSEVPVLDAVLNCLTLEQADARCNSKSQLPLSLSATAIHMAALNKGFLPIGTPAGKVSTPEFSVLATQPCGV